jgi:hypothetical protein
MIGGAYVNYGVLFGINLTISWSILYVEKFIILATEPLPLKKRSN